MKKTLSLILALVMLFSLYAVPVSAAAGDFASEATVTHGENVITASDLRRLSAGDVITITLRLTEDSGTSTMTLEGLEFDFSTYGMTYVENSAVGFEGSAISTWWSNARTTNGVLRIYQLQVRNPFTISNPVSVSARFRIDDPSVAGYDNIKPIVLNASGDVQPVTKAEYTARFNVNGGVAVSAQTVTAGTAITLPSTTREGYTFNGWTLNGQTYQAGASYTVNGDVTFTAQWTQNATPTPVPATYTVTFNANGGAGTMSAQTFTAGTAQNLTANAFTRTGYTFGGWNTAANGSGTRYADGASYTATGNVTLYAQWTANASGGGSSGGGGGGSSGGGGGGSSGGGGGGGSSATTTYTVTFNANGGSGTMSNQSFTSGTAQALRRNAFTRTGYTFSGWNTAANGSGTAYSDGQSVTATRNLTLYAQWTQNPPEPKTYTVSFDPNGGAGTMSDQTFTEGAAQALRSNAFTRTDYTFSGWNTAANGSGTSYANGASYTATANVTLYAQWTQNAPTPPDTPITPTTPVRYTVTLDLNGGEFRRSGQSNTLTADTGESVTLPAASQMILENRILSGWNTSRNGSGTSYGAGASASFTADTTLYAQWDACPHAHAQPSSSTSFEFVEGSDPHQHNVITTYGETVCADCGATIGGDTTREPENCTPVTGWRANSTTHWHNCARCGHEMDVAPHTFDANGVCTVCGYARPIPSGGGSSGGGGGGSSSGGGSTSRPGNQTPTPGNETPTSTPGAAPIASDGTTTTIVDDDVPLTELPRGVTTTLEEPSPDYTVTGTINSDDTVDVVVHDKDGNPTERVPGGVLVQLRALKEGEVVVVLDKNGNEIDLLEKSLVEGQTAYCLLDGSARLTIKYNAKPFKDMTEDMASFSAVRFTSSHELFQGYSNDEFRPAQPMNRSMLVAVLWRLEDKPEMTNGKNTFPDVVDSAYYAEAMQWATANGIVQGYSNGTFQPYQPITRQAMATLMYRYMQQANFDVSQKGDLNKFSDRGNVGGYARDSMEWAVGAGIISGKADGTLDPLGNATRAQVALMLQRMVTVMVKR